MVNPQLVMRPSLARSHARRRACQRKPIRTGAQCLRPRAAPAHHRRMQEAKAIALRQRWSTEDVEPRQALAYWVETICQSFLEIDIDSPDATRFQARLDSADLGPGSLYLVQARAQHIRRTPARIARSNAAYTILMQIREGRQAFRQHGRECSLQPGDCVVVDCNEPYELDCLGPTRAVVLRFPHEWITGWLPGVEDAAARIFRPGEGWGGALSAAMAALDGFSANAVALPPGAVAEQSPGRRQLEAHDLGTERRAGRREHVVEVARGDALVGRELRGSQFGFVAAGT
ncbi:MAG: hypothetical protein EOP08_01600, partial [Proteobacteria bacterium]